MQVRRSFNAASSAKEATLHFVPVHRASVEEVRMQGEELYKFLQDTLPWPAYEELMGNLIASFIEMHAHDDRIHEFHRLYLEML